MAILNRISPNGSQVLNKEEQVFDWKMDTVHSKHHRLPGGAVVPLEKHKPKSKLFIFF